MPEVAGASPLLDILYRDDMLVAVHKPSGLLVHRSALDRHERRFALQLLRDQLGQPVWPVHRLDKGTSGVLLFALDRRVAADLGRQFEAGTVEKTYLALVRGHPEVAGEIDHPLAPLTDDLEWLGLDASGGPQAARTGYRRLATVELPYRVDRYPNSRYALVELKPFSGRRHQLRRHLKHISHPIIGDATYGKGRHNRLFQDLFACRRLLLAAVELRISHPRSGQPLVVTAALGDDFARLVRGFDWVKFMPATWLA